MTLPSGPREITRGVSDQVYGALRALVDRITARTEVDPDPDFDLTSIGDFIEDALGDTL